MPEAQPALSEEKTIPIEDTGDSVDVELKDVVEEATKQTSVETQEESEKESSEHEEYSSSVKKRINDLTKKWREEERQKEAALQFAESAKKKNDELEKKVSSLDDSYIEEVAQKVDMTELNLKRDLAAAHQKQDFEKVAEIQAALSDNSVQKQKVLALKKKTETSAKEVPAETPTEFKQQAQPTQQKPQPSAKAQAWAKANPWFGQGEGKDEVMTFATWGIHTQLVNEGVNPESDEYYSEINNRLSSHFPDKIGKTNSNTSTASNKGAQTVAGANTRVGNKTGRRTVKLTPSQVTIAKKLGVPLDEYAKFVKE